MSRLMTTLPAFLLLGAMAAVPVLGEDQNAGDAMKLARKLTEEGAAKFNTSNAKAMAAYYIDDAKVFLVGRNESGFSTKEYNGREEIERFYGDLFKDQQNIQSKNTVEYAKMLAPDVLVIVGTFEPNQNAAEPLKVPFYQVRIKQGDKWLMSSLRIFVVGEKK
jgi:ketosteroid isomerase-like protein